MSELSSYTNRKGDRYFVHQGMTKTGKPKYFVSRHQPGAIASPPEGYEFLESINGVVSLHKPKPAFIPASDLEVVRSKVTSISRLKNYRVEVKDKTITVYEPIGLDLIDELEKSDSFSILGGYKSFAERLGRNWEDFLEEIAASAGTTVSNLKKLDAEAAGRRKTQTSENLLRNLQYAPVMRFVLDRSLGKYRAERRCYRGDEEWLSLSFGTLPVLVNKLVKYLGKESFFDLM